jgi:hypothetical protein
MTGRNRFDPVRIRVSTEKMMVERFSANGIRDVDHNAENGGFCCGRTKNNIGYESEKYASAEEIANDVPCDLVGLLGHGGSFREFSINRLGKIAETVSIYQ